MLLHNDPDRVRKAFEDLSEKLSAYLSNRSSYDIVDSLHSACKTYAIESSRARLALDNSKRSVDPEIASAATATVQLNSLNKLVGDVKRVFRRQLVNEVTSAGTLTQCNDIIKALREWSTQLDNESNRRIHVLARKNPFTDDVNHIDPTDEQNDRLLTENARRIINSAAALCRKLLENNRDPHASLRCRQLAGTLRRAQTAKLNWG